MKENMAMTYKINLTITDGKNEEKKKAIQTFTMLWDVIALYEPTKSYNMVPDDVTESNCWERMSKKLLNFRKELGGLSFDN